MKKTIQSLSLSLIALACYGQSESDFLISFNSEIDQAVVKKDLKKLQEYYVDDFVFTHGTGLVDSKESWIKSVSNKDRQFISRVHDSVKVELHNNVAILYGKLSVVRESKGERASYALWYVRVFVRKENQWQMISHRTTKEADEK